MQRTRCLWTAVGSAAALALLPAGAPAQTTSAAAVRVIARCDFEGPYSAGEYQVQEGCRNNWEWGRKDMVLRPETGTGRPGTVQRVQVRGIATGGMQFFFDIFTFHNYVNNLSGGGTLPFMAELADLRALFDTNAVKECWNTEGTNGELPANSLYTFLPPDIFSADRNDRACAFASRVWMEHAKAGANKCFIYQMHNTDSPMYMGGYQSLFISYDRSPTPAAVAAATTAYAMDGLDCLPFAPVPGVVQSRFGGTGRATWAVYDDSGVTGRRRLDLQRLPKEAEVFDVMGNDPRRDGKAVWEIGTQPLFVLSATLAPAQLAEAAVGALQPQ
jgi:hypothetical protein